MSAEQSLLQGLINVCLMQVLVVRLGWFLDKGCNPELGPVSAQLGRMACRSPALWLPDRAGSSRFEVFWDNYSE